MNVECGMPNAEWKYNSTIIFINLIDILYSMKPVKHITLKKNSTVNELVKEMEKSGVLGAGALARAVNIFEKMHKENCTIFIGVAGVMVPGGMRNIILDMLKEKWVDVLVITGANLTHDMIEALGYRHYQGSAFADDADLNKKGFNRIYDSYMPNSSYEELENFFNKHYGEIKDIISIKELLWKIGSLIENDCILKVCYENKIPVFCPALNDSGIGLMMWGILAKGKKLEAKAFEDLKEIIDIAWSSKKSGVFYIGGGTPKNYIQQAMQFSPKKAEYGIQITMDRPEHGGSSGAELKEGISWGKMEPNARFVNVICDATIALPIIYSALRDRIK